MSKYVRSTISPPNQTGWRNASLHSRPSHHQSHTKSARRLGRDTSFSTRAKMVRCSKYPGFAKLLCACADGRVVLLELVHFCWRERATSIDQPELDLVMVPGDGNFLAYDSRAQTTSAAKTNGRIFVLKFASSSQRYLFWLQSKPQGRTGDPTWFSKRDLKIGDIVDDLLQGEEIDVARVLANVDNSDNDDRRNNDDDDDDDEDDAMEDVQRGAGNTQAGRGSGGAGADATGGDVRDEGEAAREGGSDGARA